MKIVVITLLIIASLAVTGHTLYLHATISEDVKAKCVKEKRDWLYKNQYTNCLARNGR
jgi:hypothetical protein